MSVRFVRDLMRDRVFAVRPDDDLATVRDLMDDHAVRHVPVIDADGDVVGMVSHRDLLRAALIERADVPLVVERTLLERTHVRDVMTTYVETSSPETPLGEAARRMLESRIGSLPVTEGGRLVGILTEADFVRSYAESG
jgi:CBS domain-containing membrane protein